MRRQQRLMMQLCLVRLCKSNVRTIHLSPLFAELSKPRPNEEEAPVEPNELSSEVVKGRHNVVPVDTAPLVTKARPHSNIPEEEEEMGISWKKLPNVYLQLSKSRLTMLVVLTAMGGYGMAPAPLDVSVLMWTALGTGLCSAAANSFNQWTEVPYDALMTRTKNRVLVRKKISPRHAVVFGTVSGVGGALILWHLVNPLTASLGVANFLLYTSVYTPLKRISIVNTWAGAVVGAIPPLMGWAACTGTLEPGAAVLAGVLYVWQFAHFNALSWGLRGDYARAGYKMMSVTHPELCKRVALRYSVATIPICTLAPACDLTTWLFAVDSLPINICLVYLAWRFYRDADYKSSRRLFHYSLLHLPIIMALLLINKKVWQGRKTAGGDGGVR